MVLPESGSARAIRGLVGADAKPQPDEQPVDCHPGAPPVVAAEPWWRAHLAMPLQREHAVGADGEYEMSGAAPIVETNARRRSETHLRACAENAERCVEWCIGNRTRVLACSTSYSFLALTGEEFGLESRRRALEGIRRRWKRRMDEGIREERQETGLDRECPADGTQGQRRKGWNHGGAVARTASREIE